MSTPPEQSEPGLDPAVSAPADRGEQSRTRLVSGRTLARSSGYVLGGQLTQVVTGIVAVPLLIHSIGSARFGVLALVWVLIGYAGLFDLGLGRALTRITARKLGEGRDEEVPALFWTALRLLAVLGVIAAVVVASISGWLVHHVLNIPDKLHGEAHATFLLVACSLPFVLTGAAFTGSLQARQRFDLTNLVAVPMSVISYFGAVLIAQFTDNLAAAVSAVVFSRVLSTSINGFQCLRVDPLLRAHRAFDRAVIGPMMRFGGWTTVINIVNPLMLTLDRFLIGSLVTATAVSYYAVPYEAVKQMLVIATAASSVLFPAFSATVGNDDTRARRLFDRGSSATVMCLFPPTLFVVVFAPDILHLWVGARYEDHSTAIMQVLAAGIFVNGLTFVAFGMMSSTRPEINAAVLVCELPIYLGSLLLLVHAFGVVGAAIAWTGRVTLDSTAFHVLLARRGLIRWRRLTGVAVPVLCAAAAFAAGAQLPSLETRIPFYLVVVSTYLFFAWRRLLAPADRVRLTSRVRTLRLGT